jgi:hypothetical protein
LKNNLVVDNFNPPGNPVTTAFQSSLESLNQWRIQPFGLICRHDVDLWLAFSKFDSAGDADDFPLDHSKSPIGRYLGPGRNEPSEPLIGVFSSEIDKCGLVVTETTRPRTSTTLPTYLAASESLSLLAAPQAPQFRREAESQGPMKDFTPWCCRTGPSLNQKTR